MNKKLEKNVIATLKGITLLFGVTLGLLGCSSEPEDPATIARREAQNRAIRIGGDLPLSAGKITFMKAMSEEQTVIINAQIETKDILQLDTLALKTANGLCKSSEVSEILNLGVDYKLVFFNENGLHLSEVMVNQQSCH